MLDKVFLLLQESKTGILSEIKRLFECPHQIFSCLIAIIHFSNDSRNSTELFPYAPFMDHPRQACLQALNRSVSSDLFWAHGKFDLANWVEIGDELLLHFESAEEAPSVLLNFDYGVAQSFYHIHDDFSHCRCSKGSLNDHDWVIFLVYILHQGYLLI